MGQDGVITMMMSSSVIWLVRKFCLIDRSELWIGPAVLEKKNFKYRQCISSILLLSPLAEGHTPFFDQTWIPFTHGCFVPSLVVIDPVFFSTHWYILVPVPIQLGKIASKSNKLGIFFQCSEKLMISSEREKVRTKQDVFVSLW